MEKEKYKELVNLSFEEALARLEEIVRNLETNAFTLKEALLKFEEGIILSRICEKELKEAESKITLLSQKGEEILEEEVDSVGVKGKDSSENSETEPSNSTDSSMHLPFSN